MSSALFDKILTKNKLINGRLNVDQIKLKKIYDNLNKKFVKLDKQKRRHEDIIKASIKSLQDVKYQIKKNSESIQKSFNPSLNKISLLYKKMGDVFYIKARFYWHGKQREVQVGTISSVIEIINKMISNKIISNIDNISSKNLTWDDISINMKLKNAIKEIASLKSQEYVLRKLMQNDLKLLNLNNNNQKERSISDNSYKDSNPKKSDQINISDLDEDESWYDRWRKDNL